MITLFSLITTLTHRLMHSPRRNLQDSRVITPCDVTDWCSHLILQLCCCLISTKNYITVNNYLRGYINRD